MICLKTFKQQETGQPIEDDGWLTSHITEKLEIIFVFWCICISVQFGIRNTLLQKILRTDMIFYNQFIVSWVKFLRHLVEFTMPIALLQELCS